jgi:uncharacterized protein
MYHHRGREMTAKAQPAQGGSCGIAVMAKASRPGFTKTRLIPTLGEAEAARLNTAFIDDVAANLLAAADLAAIHGYIAFGPPEARPFFAFLPGAIGLIEAWCADFGDTLIAATAGVLAQGHACACLVNADSPTLPPDILAEAARSLMTASCELVLGPCHDGGYYLIGARSVHQELFTDMVWSTSTVFAETLERAGRLGLAVHVLPEWYDVDDADTLAILKAELFQDHSFGRPDLRPGEARATRRLLAEIDATQTAA